MRILLKENSISGSLLEHNSPLCAGNFQFHRYQTYLIFSATNDHLPAVCEVRPQIA